MKKILLVLALIVLPLQTQAAGPYDGIWQITETDYATVNQNGSTIIVVGLDLENRQFDVSTGTLDGNQLILNSVIDDGNISSRVIFLSGTSATLTFLSCIPNPGFLCDAPIGTPISVTKVF
ncbi:MAG TPA: hypothetical protein DCM64_11655 [Gammaproteobacteria bacterium]|jgi:hypothetical protein|nr:hypothetical protein [Gammaproteobacteria bacterium]MDP6733721.1 hypothetical protein [Gammaproteobacteria bacterium]HAJ77094.1 hypothetical protein [Gammaproteobacteria bacterium]|tara:strand:- start:427 stop:789 length:363 start_codon:yes stop_codon:yes gene_type:complete